MTVILLGRPLKLKNSFVQKKLYFCIQNKNNSFLYKQLLEDLNESIEKAKKEKKI